MNRTRTTETPVTAAAAAATQHGGVVPTAPVSVAANRVSDARVVRAATAQAAGPRVARRRPVAGGAVATPARATAPRTTSGFLRARATIPALSFFAVFGFVGGSLFNTMPGDMAQAATTAPVLAPAPVHLASQQFTAHGTYASFDAGRDAYDVTKPAPKPTPTPTPTAAATTGTTAAAATTSVSAAAPAAAAAAPVAAPNPGSAQAIGQQMVAARGWGNDQFSCLVSLWNKESGWRVNAYNPSGAYGIPQSLPGSKMASAGADWQTNPATQITWGLNYITGVYGTPCGAWAHSVANNWY